MRPLSVCCDTRLWPSFLRTMPARKPRTECCCQFVTLIIAPFVAPAGARSIATMRAFLVVDCARVWRRAAAGRAGDLILELCRRGLWDFVLVFDLGFVMGSSEVIATPTAAPPQPRRAKTRQGRTPGVPGFR